MAGNVYGLRVLRRPRAQRTAITLLAAIAVAYRLAVLLADRAALPWGFDFSAYWAAGRHLLMGQSLYAAAQLNDVYSPQSPFLYLNPPPLAAVMTPLAALFPDDYHVAFAIWTTLGLIGFVGAIWWLAGRAIASGLVPAAISRTALTLGVLALPSVSGELVNGNVDFELAILMAVAWFGITRADRTGDQVAGIAVGAATVLKVFPMVLVLWLVFTGRFRAALWAIAGAAVFVLVTLPFTGVGPWLDYPAVLLNMGGASDPTFSLAPATWLSPILGATAARVVVYLLGFAAILLVARRGNPAAGFAATVAVSLLVTPVLWAHYLAVAAVPLLIALEGGVPFLAAFVLYVLLSVQNQAALGDLGFLIARALPTIGLLGLAVALVWARPRRYLAAKTPEPA